ncbi:hypothetical protein M9Y10_039307 [Tritrichomonas musculus]|uniref:receptor protein-tyrosine kinase n=1 Tax=Tritrichomonas musculus TaxID=1915356 RepID=A0ABR2KCQ6_9EUKA
MSQISQQSSDQTQYFYDFDDENYDKDDLFIFQIDSRKIIFHYSQLVQYSKKIRDKYTFSDIVNHFPQEIQEIREQLQISIENVEYFFQLLQLDYNISEDSNLTYIQCIDLLKIAKFYEVRKLFNQINKYIKSRNVDVDFLIQMIQYEMKEKKETENDEIKINSDIENLLISKIDECFLNEKFAELPISNIYRIVAKCPSERIKSDKLFIFIKKSIGKFCVLFQFVDLKELTDDQLDEICDLYSSQEESTQNYFSYMKCNLGMIKEMKEKKGNLEEQLKISQKTNEEQQNEIKNLQERNQENEKNNEEQQRKMKELEAQINELQEKLASTEKERDDLKKDSKMIKGQIIASVKRDLIISAQINLQVNERQFDTSKSKYILSTNGTKALGKDAYSEGEQITSLHMSTTGFICKSGTYYVRCIIFDSEGKSSELVSNAVTTNGKCVTFDYKEKSESFTLCKGQYKLEVWGAKGGDSIGKRNGSISPSEGGLGGYSRGILRLNENKEIHIFVGGEGKPANSSDGATTSGGFPDGGGTKTGHWDNYTSVPGTGGGSTSIRLTSDSDFARVIVAGGGGGATGSSGNRSPGGFGGGLSGGNCYHIGMLENQGGGTQTGSTCGKGCKEDGNQGIFGQGATGKYNKGSDSGGGGGGGWYGGGSGGYGSNNGCSSGGGGSGWTFTQSSYHTWKSSDAENASKFLLDESYYLTNAISVPGNEEFPTTDGNRTEKGHTGNGYAKITPE